ncbi:MAG: hypothetical protein IPO92_08275 [Saprospiraceae bacterium]|nr:hypothetical protein [Saprospiraceae bacterium]
MNKVIFFLITILFLGCSGTKNIFKFKKDDIVFSLKKGACNNRCSVYNVDIYKNRYVVYEGLVNAERYGIFSKQLSQDEYNSLKTDYEKSRFMTFADSYSIDVEDYPLITMAYSNGKKNKIIQGKMNRPDTLVMLQRKLEKIANNPEGWKLEKEYEKQITNIATETKKTIINNIIDSELIIEPNSNTFLAQWFKKYSEYDVQLIKKMAPNANLWLITYSKQKISPDDLLSLLKRDDELKSVEFNKVVSTRDH